MMKLKNLVENFDLARLALTHYTHDTGSLDSMLPRFRISSNAVYPYLNRGQLCFLRLAPLEEKNPAHVQAEIDFIEYLRGQGYPAMRPIPDNTGRLTFLLDSHWGTYCVSAFAAVSGAPIEDTPLTPEIVYAYGQGLGQLHALSAVYDAPAIRPAWDTVLNRDILQSAQASPAVLAACDKLFNALRALPTDRSCYGLIHYDFEPDNVFWDASSHSISVIDFDDCLYGWYAMDVAQALNELDDAWAATFLEGYRSAFPFTAKQEATLPLMRQYIMLRSYARLKHCLSEGLPNPPEWMVNLRAMLEGKLNLLEKAIIV
ncbi:MAG: phosphotransferase [Clostridia bacterium]|nr:phosphotransferase [Clostridia bacterium]